MLLVSLAVCAGFHIYCNKTAAQSSISTMLSSAYLGFIHLLNGTSENHLSVVMILAQQYSEFGKSQSRDPEDDFVIFQRVEAIVSTTVLLQQYQKEKKTPG